MRFSIVFTTLIATATLSAHAEVTADNPDLKAGLEAMMRYDFAKARTHLNKYKEQMRKNGAEADYRANEALAAIPMAEDMLAGQVEQIVVLDSITIDKNKFLNAYHLSTPSGKLIEPSDLEDMAGQWVDMSPSAASYSSEDGTVRYITVDSETVDEDAEEVEEITRIYEGIRLDDGTWSEPVAIFDEDVDAAFPYMMSDGCTFYFASRSEQGLGGYDIFRSYRDSEDGTFRNPVNMGLPYNSPANDYMLAVDEYTGLGWWATDRNSPADKVTIYVFVPSEVRRNYDADTPDIEKLAALWTLHFPDETPLEGDDNEQTVATSSKTPGYKLTWDDDTDYTTLLNAIKADSETDDDATVTPDFSFTADSGKIYTSYEQLPLQARAPMQRYQEALERLNTAQGELTAMRREFKSMPTDSARHAIDLAQENVNNLRIEVRRTRNALFTALRD